MNRVLHGVLHKMISEGSLSITDADGRERRYGDGSGKHVHLRFNSHRAERAVAIDPELKLAERYMEGEIDFVEGDVYELLRIVFENSGPIAAQAPWMKALQRARLAKRRLEQINTIARASGHIRHHYDLSGELYRLFLDPDMQYSCAYFENPKMTLAEAQLAKKRHLAAKLVASKKDRILDIGCGWGGLGLYLARYLGAEITGVTLSKEQYIAANQRAGEQGLSAQAKFELQDYRLINDQFDRIVSVGMFEHVGINHYAEYFNTVAKLLKRDGMGVVHSIGRSDGPGITNPFIRRHIFPGGYIPALSEVLPHIERAGLVVTDIEILRLHYAETLKAWREAFMMNREAAKAIYDERFCRMWEFYLAASESAFRWQNLMVFQIQLAHRQEAVPLTRSYIDSEEKRLRRLDSPRTGANTETRPTKTASR
jgi:cyclopropane-fatty-acyl-phospholipid synthase